jgi:hypothetical protein
MDYQTLKQTYQIGGAVTKEAEYRNKVAIGLAIAGCLSVGGVVAFRDSAPNPLKGFGYMVGMAALIGAAYVSRRDETLQRMGEQFDKSSRQQLAADLNASHRQALRVKEVQGYMKELQLIEQLPVAMQPGMLNRWQLNDLYQPLRPQAPPPEMGGGIVQVPDGIMNQSTIADEVASHAAEVLRTDWFENWARRSGAVCGESEDGKTFLLEQVVLRSFIENAPDGAKVYILDLDYGSSHEGKDPCLWLGLQVDRHIFINAKDSYRVLMDVSATVDRRAEECAIALSERRGKPSFGPILLIIDELPALMARLTEEQQKKAVDAIANILRRGLKQGGVTFKMGTQTFAVSRTKINKDILQQTEVVLLWRAAQQGDNYINLGLRDGVATQILNAVAEFPRLVGSIYVCVTYINKSLDIQGIPSVQRAYSEGDYPEAPPIDQPTTPQEDNSGDVYKSLRYFMIEHPEDDKGLENEFVRLTGRRLGEDQMEALKRYLEGLE